MFSLFLWKLEVVPSFCFFFFFLPNGNKTSPGLRKNVVSIFQRLTLRTTGVLDLTTVEKHPLLARLDLTAANGPADYKSASRLAQLV